MTNPLPLLTIAGSDSGGAAGLQADLKTWTALGVYGMSAITAVTAQNSERVIGVHYLPPAFIAAQIDAVLSDYGAAAIKTGFLGRVEIIEVVAERLVVARDGIPRGGLPTRPIIVVDPVLVNHRGEPMFGPEVAAAYRALLLPLADLVTPNRREAELLGLAGAGEPGSRGAGEQGPSAKVSFTPAPLPLNTPALTTPAPLHPRPPAPRLLLKGAQRNETQIVDHFWDGDTLVELPQPRIDTINLHGSGDTLSAAICAFVAQGYTWLDAIRRAQAFTHEAIRRGAEWRLGAGHGPLGHFPAADH